ncbi:hypothetical protein MJI47_29505, partial [Salmonella enterica subsp. enterica serovar Kentucky]|nr:hypothetical protein [Salmonella enterica subsp. enterica serovar Kentucky]
NGRFDVKQHLQSPWNMLLGAQYEITRHFNVTTEFGFAERNSLHPAKNTYTVRKCNAA